MEKTGKFNINLMQVYLSTSSLILLQACEIPNEQTDQSHYTCDDNGEVKCVPG